MITTDQFCKSEYGEKLYKIAINAGFSCPNRDGTKGENGCIFCSGGGSGDFAVNISGLNPEEIDREIASAKNRLSAKFHGKHFIAYFQAFTNTYADVKTLRELFFPIIMREDIAVLSIATRPDCLNEEIFKLLQELNDIKPVWVELGLQTIKEESVRFINRGYENKEYDLAISRLNEIGIHTITHVILYLPGENLKDMLDTVKHVVSLKSCGIKLQLLHILKGTALAKLYVEGGLDYKLPTLEDYVDTVKKCIEIIPESMVVHRITGDAPKRLLIEPKWSGDKKAVVNALNMEINPPKPYYVYILKCADGSFYTGSTNDVNKRYRAHTSSKGAKYTKAHGVDSIIYVEKLPSKGRALSREYEIKRLKRTEKERLIKSNENIVNLFIINDDKIDD